jgi:hypothetical protein
VSPVLECGFIVGSELDNLVRDLELTFGRVDVVLVPQFEQACKHAGFTPDQGAVLAERIGLLAAPNGELPAVIVIERLRDYLDTGEVAWHPKQSPEPGKLEQSPEASRLLHTLSKSPSLTSLLSREEREHQQPSLVDMALISITPRGYTGTFPFRHLEYYIEDKRRLRHHLHKPKPSADAGNGDPSAASIASPAYQSIQSVGVCRRYSDFIIVRDYLLNKYPYRIVPKLPGKKVQIVFTDESFMLERLKSLRRFIGIIGRHHVYRKDPLVLSFLNDQNEFNVLISDRKFMSFDRDEVLLSQIPIAEDLMDASKPENELKVANAQQGLQRMLQYTQHLHSHFQALIQTQHDEAQALEAISKALSVTNELENCLCSACEECVQKVEERVEVAGKLGSLLESLQETAILESEDIVERLRLLADLFEGCEELLSRSSAGKYSDFGELAAEISNIRQETLRAREESQRNRMQNRLNALQAEFDRHQTFNKFIQYCVLDELRWLHSHKALLDRILLEMMRLMATKNKKWDEVFLNEE